MTKSTKKKSSTKSHEQTNRQPAGGDRKSLVWHIADFEEIFKMPDDARKGRRGPLAYTKSFVSLSGTSKPCETHHYERLKDLKSRPERHLLRSIFEDLKNWAAHKPQNHQGYLVTHSGRPADYDYIAAQIDNVDKGELKKSMMILSKIGLLERVSLNNQFSAEKAEQPDNSGNQPTDSGDDTDGSGSDAQSLKKAEVEAEAKDKVKTATPEGKGKATNGLTASGCKENNGNSAEEKVNAQEANQIEGQKPLPSEPTDSDALGGNTSKAACKSPPGSAKSANNQQRARPIHHEGDYEKHDVFYGQRIFTVLWPRQDPVSDFGHREITSFASKWHECRCHLWELPLPEIDRFGVRGLSEANKIARRCAKNQQKNLIRELKLKLKSNNPGKIWNALMTKISMAMAASLDGKKGVG